jgi:hypothetical protein
MKKQILTEEIIKMRSMMGLNEDQLDMFTGTDDEAPAEESNIGKRVMVYYNLHKKTFSIQYKGLVIAHADYVKLNNVEFRVRQGGMEKVRSEMSKNVHAFVIGDLVDFKPYQSTDIPSPSSSKSITYDPYKYDTFVYRDTEEPVTSAREVEMINQPGGKIFQINEITASLNEEGISYDPSKIDEFIVEAKKDIQMGTALIEKFGSAVVNSSLVSVFENLEKMKAAHQKMEESRKYLESKFNKFYDIVEMYEIGEHPDNVRELDDLANQLDNHSMTVYQLADAFDELINMTEKISRYNEELFKIQTIN